MHFRHPLYLFTLKSSSKFTELLGFDFILKFNIIIFPETKVCKIKDEFIFQIETFTKSLTKSTSGNRRKEIKQKIKVSRKSSDVDFSKLLHVTPFAPAGRKHVTTDITPGSDTCSKDNNSPS